VLKHLHLILSESGHQKRTASVWFRLRAQAREGVPQRFLDGCARAVGVKHQFCEIWLRQCVQKRFFLSAGRSCSRLVFECSFQALAIQLPHFFELKLLA